MSHMCGCYKQIENPTGLKLPATCTLQLQKYPHVQGLDSDANFRLCDILTFDEPLVRPHASHMENDQKRPELMVPQIRGRNPWLQGSENSMQCAAPSMTGNHRVKNSHHVRKTTRHTHAQTQHTHTQKHKHRRTHTHTNTHTQTHKHTNTQTHKHTNTQTHTHTHTNTRPRAHTHTHSLWTGAVRRLHVSIFHRLFISCLLVLLAHLS